MNKLNLNLKNIRGKLLTSVGLFALASTTAALSAHAIVPNDGQTSDEIVDGTDENLPENATGVGMFYRADGFVCSGTLINPRTVLFAAHCVNDRLASDFGTSIPAAWSFQTNALPGFIDWINNGFSSNPDLYVYNINQIIYNLDSIARPEGLGFLEGDIALSSLDTPASNIPTWALLFSPLPSPTTIDPETGTGYHVDIVGYGRTGSGSAGANLGIDWRRRAAENMLGSLASLDDRNIFLFGAAFGDNPQVLYNLDFDDPIRNDGDPTTFPNPFDINLFKDDPLPNEGTTAGGDSGGPLILDADNNSLADEDLVIGVLSGGSRFFGPQAFSSYGTQSFYQPLFLQWDWIAANNPYRYVGAAAGDGAWEDGDHWVSLLDPAYRVIDANGNVVNGVPTAPGAGITGTEPEFGWACFEAFDADSRVFSECADFETGQYYFDDVASPNPPYFPGFPSTTDGRGQVDLEAAIEGTPLESAGLVTPTEQSGIGAGVALGTSQYGGPELALVENQPQAGGFLDAPLPDPTIENGLAGATGFVPDNIDPDPVAGVNARYFDVTLSQAGTTTLGSTVEVDRFTLSGAEAALDITSGGSLTSLIEVMHLTGALNVDSGASITTFGDYLLMAGLVSGEGTIATPFFTSVAGAIAPGTMGTAGELTIDGSAILASGNVLLYDVTAAGNDLLTITGDVSLGGFVALGYNGASPAFGDQYTLVNYGGTASGGFSGATGLGSGVLTASFADLGGSVVLNVDAQSFVDFIPASVTGTQYSYAQALDDARATNYGDMSDLFGVVDFLAPGDLVSAFDQMAPNDSILAGQGMLALGNALGSRLDTRMRQLRRGERDFITQASTGVIEVASSDSMTGFSLAASQLAAGEAAQEEKTFEMKNGFGGFLTLDYYDGETDTAYSGLDGDIEGFVVAAGVDKEIGDGAIVGGFLSYVSSENSVSSAATTADIDGISGGLYTYVPIAADSFFDGYISYGQYTADTSRVAVLPGATFSAKGESDADQWAVGASLGKVFSSASGAMHFTPSIGFQHLNFDFDETTETGSSIALAIQSRDVSSTQISLGGLADWEVTQSGSVRLNAGGAAIYELDPDTDIVLGQFVAAPNSSFVSLAGPDRGRSWLEVEAGVDFDMSQSLVGSVGVKRSIGRDDLEQTMFGASVQAKF